MSTQSNASPLKMPRRRGLESILHTVGLCSVILVFASPAVSQMYTGTMAGCQIMCTGSVQGMNTCTGTIIPQFSMCQGGAMLCGNATSYSSIGPSNLDTMNVGYVAGNPAASIPLMAYAMWTYALDGPGPAFGVRFRIRCDTQIPYLPTPAQPCGTTGGTVGTSTLSAACQFSSANNLPVELMEFSVAEDAQETEDSNAAP